MAGDRSKIKTNHAWMGPKREGDAKAYTALAQYLPCMQGRNNMMILQTFRRPINKKMQKSSSHINNRYRVQEVLRNERLEFN